MSPLNWGHPMATTPTSSVTMPESLSMGAVLRIPVMRRLWYAQIVSNFGDFLALFAVIGFLTFNVRANPQQITGVQIAYQLPIALLGILAGVFVDRWPLKATMVASDLSRAALCLLLLLAHNIWGFYTALAAISIVSSFFGPAQGVAIRAAVPLHGLRAANALMQQVMFPRSHRGAGSSRDAGRQLWPDQLLLDGCRQLPRLCLSHCVGDALAPTRASR